MKIKQLKSGNFLATSQDFPIAVDGNTPGRAAKHLRISIHQYLTNEAKEMKDAASSTEDSGIIGRHR